MTPSQIMPASGRDAYSVKPEHYFSGARQDYVALLPNNPEAVVLELGCGDGSTGVAVQAANKCERYCAIEINAAAAAIARTRLHEVISGDVETMTLPWLPQSFDALIMSEVLEHLLDPWTTLAKLVPLLKSGGLVLASSPNIAHWRIIRELLQGNFDYADSGVMDRTHMRWFTLASYRAMFEQAGIEVRSITPIGKPGRLDRLLRLATLGRAPHLTARQINLVGIRRA